jgi:hypothetical protein
MNLFMSQTRFSILGFESSYETFMLPAINSWRFYGCIPDISVDKTQRYSEKCCSIVEKHFQTIL